MLLEPLELQSTAKRSLERSNHPGRIILIHTGVVLLVSLLLTALDYWLDLQIGTTGGLSGMDARSIWVTIQSVLRLTQVILLPFWQIGYTFYTLKVAQNQPAGVSDLWEGLRRFGPVLRLKVLMAGMGLLLTLVSAYVGSFLFTLTPWATPMMQKMEALMSTSTLDQTALIEAVTAMIEESVVPIMIIFSLCFLAGAIFLFFRFRLAEHWLMAHPEGGALAALHNSKKLMQGNWKAMFKVDLRFWWFYILELLISALCYGDVILDSFGIELTMDAFGSYLICFSLYMWAHMALYWWKKNEVAVTYAHAYLTLCPPEPKIKE